MARRRPFSQSGDQPAAARIEQKLGLPTGFIQEIVSTDSDWAFVVKIHALLETSLADSITEVLRQPGLKKRIAVMGFRQKREWAEDLHRLPKSEALFLKAISELRNRLAHEIRNVPGFELASYVRKMSRGEQKHLVGDWPKSLSEGTDGRFVRVVLAIRAMQIAEWLEAAETAHRQAHDLEVQSRIEEGQRLYHDAVLDLLDKPIEEMSSPDEANPRVPREGED